MVLYIPVLCRLTAWVFFFSLLTRLGSHLKGGNGACSLKELQDLYDGFVTFLEVCTVVL